MREHSFPLWTCKEIGIFRRLVNLDSIFPTKIFGHSQRILPTRVVVLVDGHGGVLSNDRHGLWYIQKPHGAEDIGAVTMRFGGIHRNHPLDAWFEQRGVKSNANHF